MAKSLCWLQQYKQALQKGDKAALQVSPPMMVVLFRNLADNASSLFTAGEILCTAPSLGRKERKHHAAIAADVEMF